MNGERTFGNALTDAEMSTFMNAFYNTWWRAWKNSSTDEEFEAAWKDLNRLTAQRKTNPIVRNLAIAFLYELDAKMHGGGYTQTGAEKLVKLIAEAVV